MREQLHKYRREPQQPGSDQAPPPALSDPTSPSLRETYIHAPAEAEGAGFRVSTFHPNAAAADRRHPSGTGFTFLQVSFNPSGALLLRELFERNAEFLVEWGEGVATLGRRYTLREETGSDAEDPGCDNLVRQGFAFLRAPVPQHSAGRAAPRVRVPRDLFSHYDAAADAGLSFDFLAPNVFTKVHATLALDPPPIADASPLTPPDATTEAAAALSPQVPSPCSAASPNPHGLAPRTRLGSRSHRTNATLSAGMHCPAYLAPPAFLPPSGRSASRSPGPCSVKCEPGLDHAAGQAARGSLASAFQSLVPSPALSHGSTAPSLHANLMSPPLPPTALNTLPHSPAARSLRRKLSDASAAHRPDQEPNQAAAAAPGQEDSAHSRDQWVRCSGPAGTSRGALALPGVLGVQVRVKSECVMGPPSSVAAPGQEGEGGGMQNPPSASGCYLALPSPSNQTPGGLASPFPMALPHPGPANPFLPLGAQTPAGFMSSVGSFSPLRHPGHATTGSTGGPFPLPLGGPSLHGSLSPLSPQPPNTSPPGQAAVAWWGANADTPNGGAGGVRGGMEGLLFDGAFQFGAQGHLSPQAGYPGHLGLLGKQQMAGDTPMGGLGLPGGMGGMGGAGDFDMGAGGY